MITWLQIENFKSLRAIAFRPASLNLFFGMNGMGKSSVIQSLLLLRQTRDAGYLLKGLVLNGRIITGIGRGRDVVYQNAGMDEEVSIDLRFNAKKNTRFTYANKAEQDVLPLKKITVTDEDSFDITWLNETGDSPQYCGKCSVRNERMDRVFDSCIERLSEEALFSCGFQYLSAERLAPQEIYKGLGGDEQDLNTLGSRGEFTPQYLARRGRTDSVIFDRLRHPKAKSELLIDQAAAWLGEISPGIELNVEELYTVNRIAMSIRYQSDTETTQAFSPLNVGFGIPYILPVIVALLRAGPGDLVCVENPESHLHPRGQSAIGRLMALAAAEGVQIFCESHSDHIINGIRVAVKDGELSPSETGIFYFDRSPDNMLNARVRRIEIDKYGELAFYPEGFLDEWGNLMARLI